MRRAAVAAAALACAVAAPAAAQVRPVFELAATGAGNATGRAGDATYERLGDVRPGATLGLGVGLMFRRVDVMVFGETGAVPVRGVVAPDARRDLTRNTFGLRVETPLAVLPQGFRAVGAVSALWQEFEPLSVRVPADVAAPIVPVVAGEPGSVRLDAQAWGSRLELGVEHRGFLGTAWFVLAGATFLRDAGGSARTLSTAREGWSAVPTVTLGIRSRGF